MAMQTDKTLDAVGFRNRESAAREINKNTVSPHAAHRACGFKSSGEVKKACSKLGIHVLDMKLSRNYNGKYTEETEAEAKALFALGMSFRSVSDRTGIPVSTLSEIRYGRNRKTKT